MKFRHFNQAGDALAVVPRQRSRRPMQSDLGRVEIRGARRVRGHGGRGKMVQIALSADTHLLREFRHNCDFLCF
jgi:hypothetical protein